MLKQIMRDIQSPWLIHAKGALFILLGLISSALLIAESPTLKNILLLVITIWAFCRFYYYLFYVLEKYLGSEKKFAGVWDALSYLWRQWLRPR
jgi:hypothetical protein